MFFLAYVYSLCELNQLYIFIIIDYKKNDKYHSMSIKIVNLYYYCYIYENISVKDIKYYTNRPF